RLVNGYALNKMLDDEQFNPGLLLCGAEGTLGIITEAKLKLEPIPPETALLVLESRSFTEAMSAVSKLLSYQPSAVETLDQESLDMARTNSLTASSANKFFRKETGAVLIAEFNGDSKNEISSVLSQISKDGLINFLCFSQSEIWDENDCAALWQVRKDTLGLLMNVTGDYKPLPFIEDACIPPRFLAEYVEKVEAICARYNRRMVSYGHAGAGVLHIRPFLDIHQEEDQKILLDISGEVFELVKSYGGAWSGEHGDGLVRSYKLREFYGEAVYNGFLDIKKIFDPLGLMNPGKIVNPLPPTENFRLPSGQSLDGSTFYHFAEEGGLLSRAVDKCTGVGLCLNTIDGSMCPTFKATRKEKDSPRGRANALRAALAGINCPEGLADRELYEILGNCLACKSCKTECPSHTDLAKLKAEFLAHYYQKHRIPPRNRLVKASGQGAALAAIAPGFFNKLLSFPPLKSIFFRLAGFDTRRDLPLYAAYSLEAEIKKIQADPPAAEKRVILFADTWTKYYEPRVGTSAYRILTQLGYEVVLADVGCCGRPLISAGFLKKAIKDGAKLVGKLGRLGDGTEPIIILEPSCYATLKDDYPDLMKNRDAAKKMAERVITMEEFLLRPENRELLKPLLGRGPAEILFHGHCQQKALIGASPTEQMLTMFPGAQVTTVDQGCCGMAGVFGYEKEHYELSRDIAELKLLPAIRKADPSTELVISGFSCRSQVKHFTGRESKHPAELIAEYLVRNE
ncbi:MAG: FAD-linked oxidase C-terminal domain-containing protein, partial [Acidobacteriota bacterium]